MSCRAKKPNKIDSLDEYKFMNMLASLTHFCAEHHYKHLHEITNQGSLRSISGAGESVRMCWTPRVSRVFHGWQLECLTEGD